MSAVLLVTLAGAALLAWILRPRTGYTPDPDDPLDDGSSPPIDREELERAEREVRGLSATATPEDERPEDDWGPGAPKS